MPLRVMLQAGPLRVLLSLSESTQAVLQARVGGALDAAQAAPASVLLTQRASTSCAGNVLLPVDAAGQALEVLLLLDRHWDRAKLYFTLVFVAPQARQVLELAKTQLTWMSDAVLQAFERTQSNPFALPCAPIPDAALISEIWFWFWFPQGPLCRLLGPQCSCCCTLPTMSLLSIQVSCRPQSDQEGS